MPAHKRLKIGLVLDDTLDTPDGVQQYVLGVGRWLVEQGHDVHYLVGHTTRTDIPQVHSLSRNLRTRFNGNRMSIPLPTSRARLQKFLAEHHFDIIHVQVPYSPFMAGRLLQVAPETTAIVGTFHILPYSRMVRLANRALGIWDKRSGRRFDRMLAVSEPAKEFAAKTYGYKDMEVVPNPVRLSQFAGAHSDNRDLNIIFLGRLVERKGVLQLLRAVAYLREKKLYEGDFTVHIGGKGELLERLQAFAAANGLSEVVTFHGFIGEEIKADFLAAADIAIYPSIGGESFGIVLLEAMAAARGVVLAGNNPGYASVMQPLSGESRLFDPKNTGALARLLVHWLEDAPARAEAAKAQQSYVRQFDIQRVGRRLLAVYTEALQKRRQS